MAQIPEFVSVTPVHCGRARMHWTASFDENGQAPKQYEILSADLGVPLCQIDGNFTAGTLPTDANRLYHLQIRSLGKDGQVSEPSEYVDYQSPACDFSADMSWPGRLNYSSRFYGNCGANRAVLYYETPYNKPLVRWIDRGISMPLAGSLSGVSTIEYSGIAFASESELYYGYANRVDHYDLLGNLLDSETFGTGIQIRDIIRLKDGSVIAVFQDQKWAPTEELTIHLALRSPGASWRLEHFTLAIQQGSSVRMTISQHPADGILWLFIKQDAGHWCAAVRFAPDLTLLSFDHDFFNFGQANDYPDAPEGEFPWLSCFPDPTTNTIAFAFTCQRWRIYSNEPQDYAGNKVPNFVKGAEITICRVRADGAKSFRYYPWKHERIHAFGYSIVDGIDRIVAAQIDETDMSFQDAFARGWNGTEWTEPIFVAPNRGAAVGMCEEYALVQAPDGLIHATVIPVVPEPPTPAVVVSPATARVKPKGNIQFSANQAVTWVLQPVYGSISATGLYMAPGSSRIRTIQIIATSKQYPQSRGTAIVTVRR